MIKWFKTNKALRVKIDKAFSKLPNTDKLTKRGVRRNKRNLKKAIRKADKYAAETFRQYHVLLVSGGKIAVFDNHAMNIYNKKAVRRLKAFEFKQMALYSTQWTTKRRSKGDS